jgi:RimJ/RimL family protein N-acetyltransferase
MDGGAEGDGRGGGGDRPPLRRRGIDGVDADEIEVGWVVAVAARGRGLATEAASAAIGYAFDVLGVDEVVAYTSPGNAASLRVMEKLGMVRRGEGRSRDGKPAVILVARRVPG